MRQSGRGTRPRLPRLHSARGAVRDPRRGPAWPLPPPRSRFQCGLSSRAPAAHGRRHAMSRGAHSGCRPQRHRFRADTRAAPAALRRGAAHPPRTPGFQRPSPPSALRSRWRSPPAAAPWGAPPRAPPRSDGGSSARPSRGARAPPHRAPAWDPVPRESASGARAELPRYLRSPELRPRDAGGRREPARATRVRAGAARRVMPGEGNRTAVGAGCRALPERLGPLVSRVSQISGLCRNRPVNQVTRARVIQAMSEFATLASPYSMPAATHGDVDLTDPEAQTRSRALNQFLADDALDAVQDAMLQLARAYAHRPAQEWKPLFYRILENRIRDMQRRRTVRGRVMAWLPLRRDDEDDEAFDPIAQTASPDLPPVARL